MCHQTILSTDFASTVVAQNKFEIFQIPTYLLRGKYFQILNIFLKYAFNHDYQFVFKNIFVYALTIFLTIGLNILL